MTKRTDYYPECVLGDTMGLEPNSEAEVLVYDFDKLCDALIKDGTCDDLEEAQDHVCYNASFSQGDMILISTTITEED